MSATYDVLVVGGGPAGLSAALVLARCCRRVLVCDEGLARNRFAAEVHGLLGHSGLAPPDLLAKAHAQLASFEAVTVRRTRVDSVSRSGDGFSFAAEDGSGGQARRLLIATGLTDELPRIENIERFYGRSVHHCPYCDAYEHRGQRLLVLGNAEKCAGLALMMRQWSERVTLVSLDGAHLPEDCAKRLATKGVSIVQGKASRLEGDSDNRLARLVLDDGREVGCDAVFFTTGCHPCSNLAETLGCRRDDKGGIITDALTEETTAPGVYVAGDASRDVLFVSVAIAEGAKAAVAINRSLLAEDGLLA